MKTEITIRHYRPETDHDTVALWHREHGRAGFNAALLPPLGMVAEMDGVPVAALWAHLSVSHGTAFLEQPATAWGLDLAQANRAFGLLLDAMKEALRALDYGVIIVHTLPGIARFLERKHGFRRADAQQKISMICMIGKEAA